MHSILSLTNTRSRRPSTYRKKIRQVIWSFVIRKNPGRKKARTALGWYLGYLSRSLRVIDRRLKTPKSLPQHHRGRASHKHFLVCREMYRQKGEMFEAKTGRMDDRIVSKSQPDVRPIKSGNAGYDRARDQSDALREGRFSVYRSAEQGQLQRQSRFTKTD